MTPAEDRAARDGLPVVAVTNFDLGRALSGHPIIVSDMDGNEVLLRLLTADELMARVDAARWAGTSTGEPNFAAWPRSKAVELTTPIGA